MKNQSVKILCFVAILFTMVFTSCLKTELEPEVQGPLTLRVINAAQGSSPQDFYQGNTKLNTLPIVYGEQSTVVAGKSGYNRLVFTNTGSTTANAIIDVALLSSSVSNVFLIKNNAGIYEINGYDLEKSLPPAGKIKVKFLHLGSTLSGKINVNYATGGVVQSDIEYSAGSPYILMDAGTDLTANVVGVLQTINIDGSLMTAGNNYTIWFDAASSNLPKYHIIKDN